MTRVKILILNLLLLLTAPAYAQKELGNISTAIGTPVIERKVIANYSGGRFGYSSLSLTLYSDSSYFYSSWLHTGQSYSDKGTFTRYKSKINLRSDTVVSVKGMFGLKSFTPFDNKTYRIKGNKILLYSRREELFDRNNYYSSYFTLYIVDTISTK